MPQSSKHRGAAQQAARSGTRFLKDRAGIEAQASLAAHRHRPGGTDMQNEPDALVAKLAGIR
jgi:hypothetical protein